jgi:hypothetical protein
MKNNLGGRPSISNKIDNISKYNKMPKLNYRYNMILNEQISKHSTKLTRLLQNTYTYADPKDFGKILFPIIFQIAVACYSMSLSKMVHNDLHSGNIFVEQLSDPVTSIYVINNKKYTIKSEFKVYLYDFDRSYCERFGNNPLLTGDKCEYNSQCNEYIENKDFIKSMCYFYKNLGLDFFKKLSFILLKDIKFEKTLIDMYDLDCFFQSIDQANQETYFKTNFNDMNTIIKKIADFLPMESSKIFDIEKRNINICNKDFFNEDGTVNLSEYKKIYDNTINNILNKYKIESSIKNKPTSPKKSKSRKPSAKEPKACKPNQVRNPSTGRCVLKTSPKGRKIMEEMGGSKSSTSRKPSSSKGSSNSANSFPIKRTLEK